MVQKALLEFRFFFKLQVILTYVCIVSCFKSKNNFHNVVHTGFDKNFGCVCALDAYFFPTCHELLHEHISALLICLFLLILLESSPTSFRQNISQQKARPKLKCPSQNID